jgi:hypothetical protein
MEVLIKDIRNPFELSLSEKQIPRFIGNVSSYRKWTELLESGGVRPRQASVILVSCTTRQ